MALFSRNGNAPQESRTEPPAPVGAEAARAAPVVRRRAGWFGAGVATLTLAALIVFALQNTTDVDVAFLWLDGTVPLALLIAGVGSAVVVTLIGVARMTQVRRRPARRPS